MCKRFETAKRQLLAVVAGGLLLIPIPALATTYNYTGPAYVTNADQSTFGTHLTGAVTFNFDTSNFSGTVSGLSQISNLQLTSGTQTVNVNAALGSEDYFDFTAGVITHWDVGITKLLGTQALLLGTCSPYGSSSTCFWPSQYSAYDNLTYPSAAFYVSQTGQYSLEAASYTPVLWTAASVAATPLPSSWTMMLIGLAALGFVAYRRQAHVALSAA